MFAGPDRRRGFTLVELLMVVAIIAVLVGLLLPAVQKVRERANQISCQSKLGNVALALVQFADANGGLPAGFRSKVENGVETGPGWGWASEVLPLTMSGLFRRIDTLLVQELLDYSTYPSTFMLFDVMGFGRAPDAPVLGADPAVLGSVFRAPLQMVADGLGATIDEFRFARAVAVATHPLDVAAGRVEPGTVSAMRFSATAVIDGRPTLTVEHVTRLGPDEAPDWPRGRGWRVEVAGAPSMVLEAHVGVDGEDENDQGCLGTAMHAVHAVVPVCAAPPGIATFLDLPMIVGRHTLGRAVRAEEPRP